jgi:hypothetical protein
VDRDQIIQEIAERLGPRDLVWAGIRGDDAEPLADLPQFAASFSIIGAYRNRSSIESLAYEDLSGSRVDLEVWDIDDHLETSAAAEFRSAILARLGRPSALIPYRPSRFLSAIAFARRDRCWNLGMFGGLQSAFEHKPWVESSLADLGVAGVPWTYVAKEERGALRARLRNGPLVLRRSRTSGGEGIVRVDDPDQLDALWPSSPEDFVSVAPYLADTLPLNVGATIWDDGVTIHHPSVQLIGIPCCVSRPFGYCGNDFDLVRSLPRTTVDQIEQSTQTIGQWLARHGYRGTFGVDYLLHEGNVLFTEVNPRFQGSTHASSQLSAEANESCLYLDHVAAWLGVQVPAGRPTLFERVNNSRALSHVVIHRTVGGMSPLDVAPLLAAFSNTPDWSRTDVVAPPTITVAPGAAVARITVRRSVTQSGFDLDDEVTARIQPWLDGQLRGEG